MLTDLYHSFGTIIPRYKEKIIMKGKTDPIQKKKEVKQNPDHKFDQDFKGYPHGPANEKTIKPRTKQQHKVADTGNKDGEKIIYKNGDVDEQESDGSANAFDDK